MPPVLGEPSPTLILILHILVSTFLGSNWCSCLSRCVWAVECGRVGWLFRWPCRVTVWWAYRFPAGRKIIYHSIGNDSMMQNRSILVRQRLALTVWGIRKLWEGGIYREWGWMMVRNTWDSFDWYGLDLAIRRWRVACWAFVVSLCTLTPCVVFLVATTTAWWFGSSCRGWVTPPGLPLQTLINYRITCH